MDEIRIRGAQASDGDAVIEMAERLQEGVAPWRDPQEVRRAVVGWVRESLAGHGDPDTRAFAAERTGEVVGVPDQQRPTGLNGRPCLAQR